MTDPVVTQAVRDAAADYADSVATGGLARVAAQYIREGRSDDCELVQAFAKLEAQALLEGERAGMEKARSICAQIDIGLQRQPPYGSGAAQCYHAINDAIRNTGATK